MSLARLNQRRFMFAAAFAAGLSALTPQPATALVELAARGGDIPGMGLNPDKAPPEANLVRDIQKALAELGLYLGPVNGRISGNLTAAIRNYQLQAGLNTDGEASERLLAHVQRAVNVTKMLKGLERSREQEMDEARRALLSHPATKDLLEDTGIAVADATRDPSKCFAAPTVRCLLAEAYESAKAIPKQDLRDWAMGEILTAQARAGLLKQAMETTRRIKDPRLVIVALRNIAAAQARAGREEDALAAAEIIPEERTQVQALAEIANAQTERGYMKSARDTAALLYSMARHMAVPSEKVTYATKAALTLHQAGDKESADRALTLARKTADTKVEEAAKSGAWRQIAGTLADLDQVTEALQLADEVLRPSDRAVVLIATARAAIRAGDLNKALELTGEIDAARYRALVMGQIAVAKAKAGETAESEKIMDQAFDDAESIHLPFARSYAVSRLVLALADRARVADAPPDELTARFARARTAAEGIRDARLRAHVLFEIAAWQQRTKLPKTEAAKTRDQALAAAKKIQSPVSRVWIHGDIAALHATAGETDEAWKAFERGMSVAKTIDKSWARARSLARMAQTMLDLVAPKTAGVGQTPPESGDDKP